MVMELHDSLEVQLPVYSVKSSKLSSSSSKCKHVVVVLGCVDDHLDHINTLLATAKELELPSTRVNLGPRTEMSSKVVDILQAHHNANRLLPALSALRKARETTDLVEKKASTSCGGEAKGVCGRVAGLCVLNLHFWVFAPGVSVSHLPTAQQCKEVNPVLTATHRPKNWRLPNLVLSAIAKSHGAYDRDPMIKLSFVLGGDGTVVTVGAELIQKYLGARKWGALTEHHVLVALRDAMESSPESTHPDFKAAFEHWGNPQGDKRRHLRAILVLPSAQAELQLYDSSSSSSQEQCQSARHPSLLHVIFPDDDDSRATMIEQALDIPKARCRLAGDCWNRGRSITSLQAHNNCGKLCAAVAALF